jgi:hypothetical protein
MRENFQQWQKVYLECLSGDYICQLVMVHINLGLLPRDWLRFVISVLSSAKCHKVSSYISQHKCVFEFLLYFPWQKSSGVKDHQVFARYLELQVDLEPV